MFNRIPVFTVALCYGKNLIAVCAAAILVLCSIGHAGAQNPIAPPGYYMADPSAHVWNDGKLYVYGSRHERPEYYCSWSHDVLFTSDLKSWTIAKNVFASRGSGDQVAYSDNMLFAPDCQYRNGTYYLYYCLSSSDSIEGVATSSSPLGPFVNGTNIGLYGHNQIDPCVFLDSFDRSRRRSGRRWWQDLDHHDYPSSSSKRSACPGTSVFWRRENLFTIDWLKFVKNIK